MSTLTEKDSRQDVSMPADHMICPVCESGWGFANSCDVHMVHRVEQIDLKDYVGIPLSKVAYLFSARNYGFYLMGEDLVIRNDKHIDNEEHPKYKGLSKNQEGWCSFSSSRDYYPTISHDHEIEVGDVGYFNVWKYYHKECHRINLACDMRDRFETLFKDAGFSKVFMEPVPNGYCPCEDCAPWFNVSTPHGKISIGWRKRVLSIRCESVNMLKLFKYEDVTRESSYIHAWGYGKARKYLVKIREAMITG